jgi:uncharacterized protein (DUF1501 family)
MRTTTTAEACGCDENRRMSLSRRRLLAGAAGAVTGLAGAALDSQLAFAADPSYAGDVLVLVSLRGGFDGLSAVVPAGDPAYYLARPGIAVPKSQLIGDGSFFGLNPALAPLLPFWNSGKLAAVHAVGQPAPNRSHFAAMEELERAAPGSSIRTGWLNRMLGTAGAAGLMSGVSVGGTRPSRLLDGPSPHLNLASIAGTELTGEASKRPFAATMAALYDDAPALLAQTTTQLNSALSEAKTLRTAGDAPANGAAYPDTDLGKALRDVARLIRSGSALVSATVDSGDWDMHTDLGTATPGRQMYDHLKDLATALAAFATDLGPANLNRVTVVTISEFGRRVAQNASGGLDHGYGNSMFVLGGGVKGGKVYGQWPGLAAPQLCDGDLAVTTDYRAVIGEILRARCGTSDLSGVFPGVTASRLGLVTPR